MAIGKFEIRSTKSETNSKHEFSNDKNTGPPWTQEDDEPSNILARKEVLVIGILVIRYCFETGDPQSGESAPCADNFGFRVSDFEGYLYRGCV
jgi:hypothetical protein